MDNSIYIRTTSSLCESHYVKEETVFSHGDMESDAQSSGKFSLMSFSSYTTLSNCDTGFPRVSSFILRVVVALGWEESEFIKPRRADLEEITIFSVKQVSCSDFSFSV